MDPLHRRLGQRLRASAQEHRIPLTHLADRAGVSRRQLWNVLRGTKSPTIAWLQKVAVVLDVEVADLLAKEPERRSG